MPVSEIIHRDKKVLFLDLKDMKDQNELIKDAKEVANIIIERNSPTLFLCDFTNAAVGTEFMSQMKEDGRQILRNIPVKTAVSGITGLKQILLQGYIRFTGSKLRSFDTLEEAKDYLADGEFPS